MGKTLITDFRQDFLRNMVINGNFDFWQRGTSFTNPGINAYTADRFHTAKIGTMAYNVLRSTDVPNSASEFSFHVDITTAQASVTGSDNAFIRCHLENYLIRGLYGKNVTISFWVKSPKSGLHFLLVRNGLNTHSKSIPYTVTSANTWQKIVLKTALENSISYSSGGAASGFQLIWPLAAGSSVLTSADNVWEATGRVSGIGQQNLVDNVANDFKLAQVMMIEGSEELPFSLSGKSYSEELALCQRYYQRDFTNCLQGNFFNGTNAVITTSLHVPMRAAPTISQIAGTSLTNSIDQFGFGLRTPTAFAASTGSLYAFRLQVDGMAGADLRFAYLVADVFQADAEIPG